MAQGIIEGYCLIVFQLIVKDKDTLPTLLWLIRWNNRNFITLKKSVRQIFFGECKNETKNDQVHKGFEIYGSPLLDLI